MVTRRDRQLAYRLLTLYLNRLIYGILFLDHPLPYFSSVVNSGWRLRLRTFFCAPFPFVSFCLSGVNVHQRNQSTPKTWEERKIARPQLGGEECWCRYNRGRRCHPLVPRRRGMKGVVGKLTRKGRGPISRGLYVSIFTHVFCPLISVPSSSIPHRGGTGNLPSDSCARISYSHKCSGRPLLVPPQSRRANLC